MVTAFEAMNAVGLVAFAIVGSLKAVEAEFDVLGVAFAVLLARRVGTTLLDHPAVVVPDAVGLAAFATTGALVGHEAGVSPFGVVVLGTVTGVGGGLVSDVLLQRVPFVLAEDFYASCAVAGSAAFWAVVAAGQPRSVAAAACAGLALALRLLAIRRDWRLPTVRLSAEA